ncbi:MCE family protein [bacterium]|nr:MCE family protein [bacterium]
MNKKRGRLTSDTIVGLFVLIAFVGLQLITSVIGGFWAGNNYNLNVTFESVSGLEVGAPVLVAGVRQGRVTGIEYRPLAKPTTQVQKKGETAHTGRAPRSGDVIVTLRLPDEVTVYDNGKFRLVQQGFLGDKRVEIDPGSSQGGRQLTDGNYITGEAAFDMERVFVKADAVVTDLQATVSSFKDFITDDATIAQIRETLDNLNQSVDKAYDYLERNEENVAASIENFRDVSNNLRKFSVRANELAAEGGRIDTMTADAEETVATIKKQVAQLTEQANVTIESINRTVNNVDQRSATLTDNAVSFMGDTKTDFAELSESLNETTKNLDAVITKIRRGEGTVGRLITDPEPFENLKESTKALSDFLVGREQRFYDTTVPYEDLPIAPASAPAQP